MSDITTRLRIVRLPVLYAINPLILKVGKAVGILSQGTRIGYSELMTAAALQKMREGVHFFGVCDVMSWPPIMMLKLTDSELANLIT